MAARNISPERSTPETDLQGKLSSHFTRRQFVQSVLLGTAITSLLPQWPRLKAGSGDTASAVDLALMHIEEQMDLFHGAFDVFTDPGAAGNHFFALTKIGDVLEAVDIDLCSQEQLRPGAGITAIKNIFRNVTGTNFAGWYFLNGVLQGTDTVPSPNFGTVANAGVDLRGATQLTFYARGKDGGEQVEFFMGGVGRNPFTGEPDAPFPDSTPRIPSIGTVVSLTQQWSMYTIDLSGADLSYVLGGFGYVTSAANNPNGATFWIDDVRYNKSRLDEPRLVRSYVPTMLQGFDQVFTNVALTYDNALAILAFLARGTADDLRRARLIGDALVYAGGHDPFYQDGRLRNGYQAGDLTNPPGWSRNGEAGHVRLPVIINCGAGPSTQDKIQISSSTEVLAWAVIALLALHRQFGDLHYKSTALNVAGWIKGRRQDTGSGGYKSGFLGGDGSSIEQSDVNTSDNITVFRAFLSLANITGDSSWQAAAAHASQFVRNVYDSSFGCLLAGTLGSQRLNRNYLLLKDQALALLAFPDALSVFPDTVGCAKSHFQTNRDSFIGFDFNDDRDAIWFQGTAMMALAYKKLGQPAKAEIYLEQLRTAQASTPNSNGKGIVEVSHDGASTGFSDPMTGQNILLYRRLHIGTTAIYALAEMGINLYPQDPASPPLITGLRKQGKNLLVSGQNFDTGAVILLNDQPQKTSNDEQTPTTLLTGKKAGKKIRPGDKVRVKNPDGLESNEVAF
ncbi:MAG: hypothetical protein WBV94_16455 [Blastocatellia bacterium]